MRRAFIIISIILIITGLVVGIMWLSARRSAVKNNAQKPTFREFVTGDSRQEKPTDTAGGTLTGVFAPDQEVVGGGMIGSPTDPVVNDSILTAPGTQTSTFTNDTLTVPSSPNAGGSPIAQGTPTSGGSPIAQGTPTSGGSPIADIDPNTGGGGITPYNPSSPTTTGAGGTPSSTGSLPSVPAPQCSDADVNIVFTSEELARLKTLERRFFTIAESIRTDEDIAREITNHDTFELKGAQILELYNICIQKSDRLTNPIYKRRVRTPFWNTTTDAPGFVTNEPGAGIDIFNTTPPNPLNSNNTPTYKRILERSLRLNLW